jgi:hypothetical protein
MRRLLEQQAASTLSVSSAAGAGSRLPAAASSAETASWSCLGSRSAELCSSYKAGLYSPVGGAKLGGAYTLAKQTAARAVPRPSHQSPGMIGYSVRRVWSTFS